MERKGLPQAEHHSISLNDGRKAIWINHPAYEALTVKQLVWWFTHLFQPMNIHGRPQVMADLWKSDWSHKMVLKQPGRGGGRGIGPGAEILVAHQLDLPDDLTIRVVSLNEEGVEVRLFLGPAKVGEVHHLFFEEEGRVRLVTNTTVGREQGYLGRRFTALKKRSPVDKLDSNAWVRFMTERMGKLEFLIPQMMQHPDIFPEKSNGWPDGTQDTVR